MFLNTDAFRRIKAPEITGAGKAFWVREPSCIGWSWLLSHSAGVGREVWEKACRYFSLKTVEIFISNPIKVPLRALEKSREGVVTAERLCHKMKRVCGSTLENNKRNLTQRLSLCQCPNKYGDKLILWAESKQLNFHLFGFLDLDGACATAEAGMWHSRSVVEILSCEKAAVECISLGHGR